MKRLASGSLGRFGLIALGVLLLTGFGVVVSRSGPLAPTRVTVVRAGTAAVSPALFGIGTVEARRSYFIGPTAPGRLAAIHVDVGDAVAAGQVLAEIDPIDLDERLRALEAASQRAGSAVAAAEAMLKDGKAREEMAAINARRYADLGRQRFVSSSAVEGKEQESVSARAAREAAEANLIGARQELARLQADRDGLRQQRHNLRLMAPRDAVVTSRDAEPGSTVVAGQSVVKLMDPGSLWVKVRLDQGRSRGLAVGLPAEVALRSNPSAKLAGQVVRVEPVSDSITEERIAQVALAEPPAGLTVGELAEVTVRLPPAGEAIALPNAAVKHTVEGAGVWVVKDGDLAFVPVEAGAAGLDGWVQVRKGLAAGEEVVVHSERALSASSRIKVVERLAGGTM